MDKKNRVTHRFIPCVVFVLLVGVFLGISQGTIHAGIGQIWESIFRYHNTMELTLIRDVRIPRVLCVLFTGGVLGITGAMMQGITKNPIAEPSLLGVSQGATLMISIFYAVGISVTVRNVMLASLIGAFGSGITILVFISRKFNQNSISKILLGGTAMGTFFLSLTTVIGLLTNQAQFIAFWVGGGFRNVGWQEFLLIIGVGLPGYVFAVLLSEKINILNLGDDVAIELGENPKKIKLLTLLLTIIMCAAAVAVGKNIGFVGLIIPQITKKVVGEDYKKNIPICFLLGAVLLTYSDIAARLLLNPYEVPIGIFTALIGVPFFMIAARKEKG